MKTVRRLVLLLLACCLPWFATEAHAGCSTIVTLNPTGHWVWITIYDLAKTQHLDYGWVGPHDFREWKSGGYACGSFYHVRYEVKNGTSATTPTSDPGNLFDTDIQINPQLTLYDILSLMHSIGDAITCVVPGAEAGCIEEWGLSAVAEGGAMGVIGSESNNSVVCIKPNGNGFYLENSGNCALRPGPLPKPKPPPNPYSMLPATAKVGLGTGSAFQVHIYKNGTLDMGDLSKGRFYSDNPGIANFPDPHSGKYKTFKKGTAHVHWDFANARQASATIEVQ
jgi:hypothetical protein